MKTYEVNLQRASLLRAKNIGASKGRSIWKGGTQKEKNCARTQETRGINRGIEGEQGGGGPPWSLESSNVPLQLKLCEQ